MLPREPEFARQVLADEVAIQQRDLPAAVLEQLGHQCPRHGRLAGTGETGEEHREALLVARRVGPPEFRHHLGEGEPLGNLQSLLQPPADFRAGDVQDLLVGLRFLGGDVLRALLHIDHFAKRHHADVEFLGEVAHELLRFVGAIEGFALRVLAGAGMVPPDDEMRAAVVLADDGVPEGLARARHAHGKVQQRERRGLFRVLLQHVLVAAHPRVVVHVTRPGQSDHRLDQQVGFDLAGRAEGQLLVRAVQRIAGLEGHDLAPAELAEPSPEFGR